MSVKQELQKLNNQLDKCKGRLASAEQRNNQEHVDKIRKDIDLLEKKITQLKGRQEKQLSSQAGSVKAMAFSRALTKAEQADMGALKKTVRGLVVVHPMTALGREMAVKTVTGFAPVAF